MPALVFAIGVAVVLFGMVFITRRRFGRLGLALAAGSLISANVAGPLSLFLEQQGITLEVPPLSEVVASALIILPPVLLLFGGPRYSDMPGRIIGSAAFTVLALAFLSVTIGSSLALDGLAASTLLALQQGQSIIVVIGLVAAVLDIMLYKPPKDKDKKGKK